MRLSGRGALFIAGMEGTVLHPYNDPAGYATIGIGHLLHKSPVTKADKLRWRRFKAQDAIALLRRDVASCEAAVNRVKVKLTQDQFDALVSFVFNVGIGAFTESTLLRELNAGHYNAAADQLLRWDKAGGRHLPGLTSRRIAERKLFLGRHPMSKPKRITLPRNWWKRWVFGDVDCNRDLLVALARLGKAHKVRIFVRSGRRSRAEQEVLYARYRRYGHPLAARPGTSRHETGRAADCQVNGKNLGDRFSRAELRKYGLVLPVVGESWHAELRGQPARR